MAIKLENNICKYFLDDEIIDYHSKVKRVYLPATVYPYPAIVPDRDYEAKQLTLFGTVLNTGDGYRIYYHEWDSSQEIAKTYIAKSEDGLKWKKPDLNIIDYKGSKENNIVLNPDEYNDGSTVTYNPEDEYPYKILVFKTKQLDKPWSETWGLYGYESIDGLNWRSISDKPLIVAGDRTNLMLGKDNGKYVSYTRHKDMIKQYGVRCIYRIESDDFINWSEPQLVLLPDMLDNNDVELYGMSVFKRNNIYFGLLEIYHSKDDRINIELVYSRDGIHWERNPYRTPFIDNVYDWNKKWISCASNGPIYINEQMVFYFGGRLTSHHFDSAQKFGAIGYASLPIDRFCALESDNGGVVITKSILWQGGNLVLNADTRSSFDSHPGALDGEIVVEILDENGKNIPEFSDKNKVVFKKNTHMRCMILDGTVKFKNDIKKLKGRVIKLKFTLNNARLFTIKETIN